MSDDEKKPLTDQVADLRDQLGTLQSTLSNKAEKADLAKKADKEDKTTFLGLDVTHLTQEWKSLVVEVVGLKVAMDIIKFEIPSVIKFNEEALMKWAGVEYRQIGGEAGVVERWGRVRTRQGPNPPANETDTQRTARLQREAQQAQTTFDRTQSQITQLQQQSQTAMQQIQSSATGLRELEERARAAAAAVGGSGGGAGGGGAGAGSG
ncbi:hypothetical protein [Streptomyces ziwulingensis]|uniref:Uncharacterized protein n=1 Tax=Streptomyces ziwulingensis TaxID=1045501 RepID=A0ABP9APT4_9ACTN